MKKLMIAALVAAVTGAASAAEYVYDFSATLKTTKSKFGKATTKIQLGVDNTGTNFWYADSTVTNYLNAWKKISSTISVPTIDFTKLSEPKLTQAVDAVLTLWNHGNGTYKYQSGGVWCATWTVTDEDCYRVAGSVKYSTELVCTNCCVAGQVYANVDDGDYINIYSTSATGIGEPLYQWFGSLAADKATKVEMYANVTFGTKFAGWLAGQGTRAKRNGAWYLSTISGNIVGTMPAPKCENCCVLPIPSLAFDCANLGGAELPFTAAYGTFRMKINTRNSIF